MKTLSSPYAALLYAGGIAALMLAIIVPLWNQHTTTGKRLELISKQADTISRRADHLVQIRHNTDSAKPLQTSTLFAEVESLASRLGILEKIVSMKPSTVEEQGRTFERVNITASGLYQQKGVALLHALEKERRRISVEQLSIRLSKERMWELSLTVRRTL